MRLGNANAPIYFPRIGGCIFVKKEEFMKQAQAIFYKDFGNSYIPHILKEIYIDKVYEPFLQGKKDLTVIDAGANISLFSQYIYDRSKVIYAIEPSADHFECIVQTKNFNHLNKIIPIKIALSHENGEAKFFHSQNTTMYSLNNAVSDGSNFESVETMTMEKLFDDFDIGHIDFMKVDIEGAESEVFSSEGFSRVADKIDIIVGENHAWSNSSPQMLKNTITDNGFSFKWLNATEATLFVAERIR